MQMFLEKWNITFGLISFFFLINQVYSGLIYEQ